MHRNYTFYLLELMSSTVNDNITGLFLTIPSSSTSQFEGGGSPSPRQQNAIWHVCKEESGVFHTQ